MYTLYDMTWYDHYDYDYTYDYDGNMATEVHCLEWCQSKKDDVSTDITVACEFHIDAKQCFFYKDVTNVVGDGNQDNVCWVFNSGKIFLRYLLSTQLNYDKCCNK